MVQRNINNPNWQYKFNSRLTNTLRWFILLLLLSIATFLHTGLIIPDIGNIKTAIICWPMVRTYWLISLSLSLLERKIRSKYEYTNATVHGTIKTFAWIKKCLICPTTFPKAILFSHVEKKYLLNLYINKILIPKQMKNIKSFNDILNISLWFYEFLK